jgi:hypothetical protein
MSFFLTEPQLLDGTKTVTRRLGWKLLKPETQLLAVNKCQGLKPGEKARILATVEVVSVRQERLDAITQEDCAREGFPHMSPREFVTMFCRHMKCQPETVVTRIEFRKVSES